MKRAMSTFKRRRFSALLALVTVVAVSVSAYAMISGQNTVLTTIEDFFVPGTQPEMIVDEILHSVNCVNCHGIFPEADVEVASNWTGSMMAQAARDPLFYACLAVANQDAADSGDICIRCHTLKGWLEGRSSPETDGSALIDADRDGVNCHTCHRMVDPVFKPGVSPPEDEEILNELVALGLLPERPGNGSMVIDPYDRRRGPFDFVPPQAPPPHPVTLGNEFIFSPFHQTSELCATCHDVSNPAYERQPDGTYALGALDAAHSTDDQYDMFPIERTYSEWLFSEYPSGVDAGGRFGGNVPDGVVSTCQDCHMPDREGRGCFFKEDYPLRTNMPRHDFAGGNSWIRDAIPDLIAELWPDDAIVSQEFYAQRLQDGQDRTIEMLQLAATLEPMQDASRLNVRVTNESGHKLPTGYPEGRRMWINVQFFDEDDSLLGERGAYNLLTADLDVDNTAVFEIHLGLDAITAAATGLPEGVSFHFVLNNKVYKDNRIPPRGFTNAGYEEFGGAPVNTTYADGQYWSDTPYALPIGAASATVNLYYQTSAKDYIEFLRDENHTNDWGQRLHDLWQVHGMSEPVLMASHTIALTGFVPGDFDGDGDADLSDFAAFDGCATGPRGEPYTTGCEVFDFDFDLDVDFADLGVLQRAFTGTP